MAYTTGRLVNSGIALEGTEAVHEVPNYEFQRTDFSWMDTPEKKLIQSNFGVIDTTTQAYITKHYSGGSVGGPVFDL